MSIQNQSLIAKAASEPDAVTVNLNGIWNFTPDGLSTTTMQVPCFYLWKLEAGKYHFSGDENGPWKIIEDIPQAVYKRNFDVPGSMSGKNIFLHFESVNYLADIYVNSQYVGSHVGGLLPFELDITSYVNVPSSNTLEVHIRYWDNRFVEMGGTKNPRWPVGFWRNYWYLGIVNDVYLIARSPVYVEDTYVQTSVRQNKLNATITVQNADVVSHTVDVKCEIESPYLLIGTQQVQIASGASVEVSFEKGWPNPVLWFPENPHLYNFVTSIYENQNRIHRNQLKIGFREFWIEGDHYVLNGIRRNLRGDNIVYHGGPRYWDRWQFKEDMWNSAVDSMLSMHFNVIRFHELPPPQWMIDVCDEKGMMVVAESHIYPNWVSNFSNYKLVVDNFIIWLKDWIKAYRHHPSIVIWSAANEMYSQIDDGNWTFCLDDYILFGNAIEEMDQTRPILFEGDLDLAGNMDTYSIHYPGGWQTPWPHSTFYALADYVHETKPSSLGEFDFVGSYYTEETRVRMQCCKTRAGRYVGFDDIRPYRLDWAWFPDADFNLSMYGRQPTTQDIQFLINTMSPVAVFDKYYYQSMTFPPIPEYDEGTQVNRVLIVFNDDIENESVEIKWRILVDNKAVDEGALTANVNLGNYVEKQLTFLAPYVSLDELFELELTAWKGGIKRYSERYQFQSNNIGPSPAKKITDLAVERTGDTLSFSWSPVTLNLDDMPITVDHYSVYRANDLNTLGQPSSLFLETTETDFSDYIPDVIGNSSINYFYGVKTVDTNTNTSELSNIIGEFDYDLFIGNTTGFNHIALPLILIGVENAEHLANIIPYCNSVAQWNPINQSYDQYYIESPLNNFLIEGGKPYYVHVSQEETLTFVGELVDVTFNLKASQTTDINEIMLPLNKLDITKASQLVSEVPYCNSAGKWDPFFQGFQQYVPSVPPTDFNVIVGYPYYVNVTQNSQWPGTAQKNNLAQNLQNSGLPMRHIPHLVWGKIPVIVKGEAVEKIRFEAFLIGHENKKLTELSPGSVIENGYWAVQCASFDCGWKAGEVLQIVFTNMDNQTTVEGTVELTWNPADPIDCYCSDVSGKNLPTKYNLSQNYPNPFNAVTTIRFEVPEPSYITLKVYDTLGREVSTLIDDHRPTGQYQIQWKADGLASGVYFYRFTASSGVQKHIQYGKCIFMK